MKAKYNTIYSRIIAGIIDGSVFLPLSIIDSRIDDVEDHRIFISWTIFYLLCWMLYVVIGHGKYGQTIGKRLMNLQVLHKNEHAVIGFGRAFIRESVWFFAVVAGIVYFIVTTQSNQIMGEQLREVYFEKFISRTIGAWFLFELITSLANQKRRALQDFLAGSVVVDNHELRKEDLNRRREELTASLQGS